MEHKTETKTTYLITGANRGIGNAIARNLLQRADTAVIVCCRPQTSSQTSSEDKPDADSEFDWSAVGITGHAEAITMDLSSDEAASAGIGAFIKRNPSLKLDVIIHAAGMVSSMKPVDETTRSAVLEHVNVNVNGTLRVWQGLGSLLLPSESEKDNTYQENEGEIPTKEKTKIGKKKGLFVALSSSCGSIADLEPVPGLAYGVSKAGLNYLVRKIQQEHEDSVCAVAVHPGWVRTGMGQFAADAWGAGAPPLGAEESAEAVVKLIDGFVADPESSSGKFWSFDGSEIRW